MAYAMENSAPGTVEATKLGGARKGPDAASVTKRYVRPITASQEATG